MIKTVDITLIPEKSDNDFFIEQAITNKLNIEDDELQAFKILKRSIDARKRLIKINLKIEVYINEAPTPQDIVSPSYKQVAEKTPVVVIGAGPAGLFAALQLIENGKKPIVIERGKSVKERRRDLAAINKDHIVNGHSNYCFGEGGAGTYSDGKLYTRSNKRGDVNKVLQTFIDHGAEKDILVDAHPHIGTNKLPKIIEAIRETILSYGGEIRFNACLTDINIANDAIKGITYTDLLTKKNIDLETQAVILATGHSARDIFELLHKKNIEIEAKTFAMGVRVEHPQSLIDGIQYHCSTEEVAQKREHLPAASYSLVHQALGRGVYSFCNCPGGIIAPCATSQNEVVTNGWSPSKRNNPFSNSGIVVTVEKSDYEHLSKHGPLAGLRYQEELEKMAWEAGGKTQVAPAQRLVDFIENKTSESLPTSSYLPGIVSAPLHSLLPKPIAQRLQLGFIEFGKKLKGYLSKDAVIVGVESRTSSPVRIPRDKDSLEHPQIRGLYPCGEGAGYAGGIASAAIDGQKCANGVC